MSARKVLSVVIMAAVVATACAAKPRDSGQGTNVDRKSRAAFGADVVAYYSLDTDSRFVAGDSDFAYEWKGATWLFSSQENLDTFKSDPDQYAPQYGGYCSNAMSQNRVVESDPDAWEVRQGKLYLFNRKKGRSEWRESPAELIALADGYWPAHLEALVERGNQ